MKDIASAKPEAIEVFLLKLKDKLESGAGANLNREYAISGSQPGGSAKNYDIQFNDIINTKASNTRTNGKSPAPSRLLLMAANKNKFKVLGDGDEAKNQVIQELRETIEVVSVKLQILEAKVSKMEMLVRLKDEKVDKLQNKLAAHGHLLE